MAADNRSKFIVDLAGNVVERARRFGSSIRQMGADGSRSMRLFQGATNQVNGLLDKFDNKLMGFVTGGGLVMMGKNVANQQQLLTELGAKYNMTADQVNNLNEVIWQTAANRKMPYADLLTAADAFLEKTNKPDALLEQIDNVALGVKGVGLEAATSGKAIGTLWNKGIKDAGTMLKTLDGFSSVSMSGAGNLSEQLDGLINLTHGTNWQKPEQLLQLLKMQRLSSDEFGSDGQSSGALQSMFEALKDKEKRSILKRNGIDVYSDKKTGEFKNPADLLLEIGQKAKYKERNLSTVFSGDMLKMAMSFSDKDKQQQLRAPDQTIDGLVNDKAMQNVQTMNGAITSLTNAGERFAQLTLAKPIQDLADAINDLSPEELEKYAETIKNIALGVGGLVAARYAYRGGKSIAGMFGAGKGAGPLGGAGAGGAPSLLGGAEVVKVFVTNWPNGGGNGNGDGNGDGRRNNQAGRIRGSAVAGSMQVLSLFDPATASDNLQNMRDEAYGNRERKYTWANPTIDMWLQDIFDQKVQASPYQPAPNPAAVNQTSSLGMPYGQQQKPPEGEIKLKIELPEGATVKSTQVQSTGVGLSVNTGNTYTRPY